MEGSIFVMKRASRGSVLFRRTRKRGDSGNHGHTIGITTSESAPPRYMAPVQPQRGRMNACMAAPINEPPIAPQTTMVENVARRRRGAISDDSVTRFGTMAAAHRPVSTRQIVNSVGLVENTPPREKSP